MPVNKPPIGSFLTVESLQSLLDVLKHCGFSTIGPQVQDGAVVYGEINSVNQLPLGLADRQDGGFYRLEKSEDAGYFDYVVGPDSLKKYLFPSCETLLESVRSNGSWQITTPPVDAAPLAVIGLRSCDLHALAVQDRVFMGGAYVDPGYAARRKQLFIVAVNCRRSAPTCFCHSMKTGPVVESGFDLALSEIDGRFVVRVGSDQGAEVMMQVAWAPSTLQLMQAAQKNSEDLERSMHERELAQTSGQDGSEPRQRHLDISDVHDLLLNNLNHPRWAEVAERCLSCANCTMVCPTCFCVSIEEVGDLTGNHVRRERRWDSCFTAEHSYMNTGTVRKSTTSRYRQWLTHKLATWVDQFGVSGCVGCGRCITWCPVGIDLTEEVAAIRGDQT